LLHQILSIRIVPRQAVRDVVEESPVVSGDLLPSRDPFSHGGNVGNARRVPGTSSCHPWPRRGRAGRGTRGGKALLGGGLVAALVVAHALLEFLLRLAEGTGERRQLRSAEEHENDEQDDQKLGGA